VKSVAFLRLAYRLSILKLRS